MIRPLLLMGACFCLAVAGCGGHASATKAPTRTPATATATPSIVAVQTITPTPGSTETVAPTATPTQVAHATIEPIVTNNQEPVVVSASLNPSSVAPGGAVHATVFTRGPVSRVVVYLGTVGPQAPAPVTYELTRATPGKWTGAGTVPSNNGMYSYTVGLFDASGHRSVVSGAGWVVQIGNGQGSNVSQPLPADVPLAPPFSYGNPVSSVFAAEGKSINGSEVSSNQRTDVSPDAVAQFYESRLPRNGWAVDQSTVPAAGAFAWVLNATKGNRVVSIQLNHSTVHIFYGNSS